MVYSEAEHVSIRKILPNKPNAKQSFAKNRCRDTFLAHTSKPQLTYLASPCQKLSLHTHAHTHTVIVIKGLFSGPLMVSFTPGLLHVTYF